MSPNRVIQFFAIAAGILVSASIEAVANPHAPVAPAEQVPAIAQTGSMNIVEIASGNDSFSTLVQAVQAAGLVDTLASGGPFTVFAPTNEAFATLPTGALEFLLRPENRSILQRVLTYHVVSGAVTSNQVRTGTVQSLDGGLSVLVTGGKVVVNNASVIDADIQASNGVIHVVNRVLISDELQAILAEELGVDDIY